MTNLAPGCKQAAERLDDYLDGTLSVDEQRRVERHLADCADCREEERTLRAILAQAEALPAERVPPRDLWPGVRDRLAPRRGRWRFGTWSGGGLAGLAAAAAVVIAVAGSWVYQGPRAPVASPTGGTPAPVSLGSPLHEAEREYARATTDLMVALDARREQISPETMAVVEENLRTIDVALGQIRAALAQDPSNPDLARMLTSTHRRKVDVLQRVVRLSRS
jgi:predicted anti-sigma-YlaC factor YlaD